MQHANAIQRFRDPQPQEKPAVIVIDDDARTRLWLRLLLAGLDTAVKDYPSAERFLAEGSAADGDCLIVDVRMPGMSGLELQEHLRKNSVRAEVIVITGFADVALAVAAMKAGAFDFVEKSGDSGKLLDAVRRALEAGHRLRREGAEAEVCRSAIGLLTGRERDVFEKLVEGKSSKVIGHELGLSPRTVEVHRAHLKEKLGARKLSDLIQVSRACDF